VESEVLIRHEEQVHPGSWVAYSLSAKGLLQEEFTSGVKTHSELIFYDEIWDSCSVRDLPKGRLGLLAVVTVLGGAAVFIPPIAWYTLLPAWLVCLAAWVMLFMALKVVPVALYDYEGRELATLHGDSGANFSAFLEELEKRIRKARYPLQRVFEGLNLGGCNLKVGFKMWSSTLLYDRVVFETKSRWGFSSREFFALTSLRAPLRLAWRIPKIPLAAAVTASFSIAPAFSFAAASTGSGWIALLPWSLVGFSVTSWFVVLWETGAAVSVSTMKDSVATLLLPWWRVESRREVLRWFAAVVELADQVDAVRTEDYWEYHRIKLKLLKDAGFLDDWPYRSALARLNIHERAELGL